MVVVPSAPSGVGWLLLDPEGHRVERAGDAGTEDGVAAIGQRERDGAMYTLLVDDVRLAGSHAIGLLRNSVRLRRTSAFYHRWTQISTDKFNSYPGSSAFICGFKLFLLKTIKPMLAMMSRPPRPVWGGSFSPSTSQPMTTASNGVTSEIIIAFVDSILSSNQ